MPKNVLPKKCLAKCFGSATALKPHTPSGCAAQAAAGSSVQSHLGSGLASTLPSPGACGLLNLSCSEQRICDCYLSQSATICSFSVFSVRPSGSSRCECRCRTWELCMCLLRWSSPALFSSTSCCDVRLDSTIPQTCRSRNDGISGFRDLGISGSRNLEIS